MTDNGRFVVAMLLTFFLSMPGQLAGLFLADGTRIPEAAGALAAPVIITVVIALCRPRNRAWRRGAIVGGAIAFMLIGACLGLLSRMTFR